MTKRLSRLRLLLALPMALVAALLLSGQAFAIIYTHQTGTIGAWSWTDTSTTPWVVCNYGPTLDNNHYFMTKIVVQPPAVYSVAAAPQQVSWQFQIQRKYYPSGTWKVVDSSAVQKGTAHATVAAGFTQLKLKHNGHQANGDTNWTVRIQILVKWYKPNGSVAGTLLFRPSYYTITTPDFTGTGGQHWCQEIETSG